MNKWFPIFTLFLSNIFLLFFAATGQIGFYSTILIFWFQSVIIGFFHFLKMLNAKNVEIKTELKPTINGQPIDQSGFFKKGEEHLFYPLFFVFHYGIFHLVYAGFIVSFPIFVFLSSSLGENSLNLGFESSFFAGPFLLISIIMFFIHHLISFKINFDPNKKIIYPNFMFYPYPRIIPMHLIIVVGFGLLSSGFFIGHLLMIFIILKTIADVIMHLFEHKQDYKKSWITITAVILVLFLVMGLVLITLVPVAEENYPQQQKPLYELVDDCYGFDFPEDCLTDLAIERGDDSICEEMRPISWKYSNDANQLVGICYNLLAEKLNDTSKCELIQSSNSKQFCIDSINYKKFVETRDKNLCEQIITPAIKDSCITNTK